MTDLIQNLAKSAGVDTSMAQKGLGALLSSVKDNVPSDTFSKISSAVPESGNLLSMFQNAAKSSGSGGGMMEAAGNLLGGDAKGVTSLLSNFTKAGFTMESAKAFIPVAIGLLQKHLSPDLMKKIDESIPGVSGLLGGSGGSSNPLDSLKKMF